MAINHHPSDETILRYAAGALSEGLALVVATHASLCAACADRVTTCETLGGAMLEALPPAPLSPDATTQLLSRLDTDPAAAIGAPPPVPPRAYRRPEFPVGSSWPAPLRHYDISGWRFLGPGIRYSAVDVPAHAGVSVMLLKAAPNTLLPSHGHRGAEFTCVLTGSFTDATGRFGVGDLIEADEELDHQPTAGPEADCVCLIAVEGRLRLHSLIGRVLQPFLGV